MLILCNKGAGVKKKRGWKESVREGARGHSLLDSCHILTEDESGRGRVRRDENGDVESMLCADHGIC